MTDEPNVMAGLLVLVIIVGGLGLVALVSSLMDPPSADRRDRMREEWCDKQIEKNKRSGGPKW